MALRSSLTLWLWGGQAGSLRTWGEPGTHLHTQSPSQELGSPPPRAPQGCALQSSSGPAWQGRWGGHAEGRAAQEDFAVGLSGRPWKAPSSVEAAAGCPCVWCPPASALLLRGRLWLRHDPPQLTATPRPPSSERAPLSSRDPRRRHSCQPCALLRPPPISPRGALSSPVQHLRGCQSPGLGASIHCPAPHETEASGPRPPVPPSTPGEVLGRR